MKSFLQFLSIACPLIVNVKIWTPFLPRLTFTTEKFPVPRVAMLKKNLINILIILLAALLIIIVNMGGGKKVEAIENDIHQQLPETKAIHENENYS